MAIYLYVDQSNLWIEGQHLGAVRRGLAPNVDVAQDRDDRDPSFRVDFRGLYRVAAAARHDEPATALEDGGGPEVARAVLYGSGPSPEDPLWEEARAAGFHVVAYPRERGRPEKRVDVRLTCDVMEDACDRIRPGRDTVVLVSGDGDYVPMVRKLTEREIEVRVAFWNHAARALKTAASRFVGLNRFFPHLELEREATSEPTPTPPPGL